MTTSVEDIKAQFIGGGCYSKQPPQFSNNGEFIYVIWKNRVICYCVKTSKQVREFCDLENEVVGFNLHLLDNCEVVIACSNAGEVVQWKADSGLRISKNKIPLKGVTIKTFNVINQDIADNSDGSVQMLLSWTNAEKNNSVLLGTYRGWDKEVAIVKKDFEVGQYAVSISPNRDPYFALVQGSQLYYSKFSTVSIRRQGMHKSRQFTCVACHPEHECIITGDSTGRIVLWYNLGNSRLTQQVFHWHTLPVQCLAFSTSGKQFYSGADECVLVRWNIDNHQKKDFLPRLGAGIRQVAVANNNQYITVITTDNAVQTVNLQFETVGIIQHLVLASNFSAGILFDNRTKCLVMNGLDGHLQFYSTLTGQVLYNLDIVNQNRITRERNCEIANTNVTKMAIDMNGSWLATVEGREDVDCSNESRLKFWAYDSVKQEYVLNTSIEMPHETTTDVDSVQFQPLNRDGLRCVTVGGDTFKIWQLQSADNIYSKGNTWRCTRVGFFRNLACACLAFSADGSLLAVGFDTILTVWLPDTCEMKNSLIHRKSHGTLKQARFGVESHCHLVVAITDHQLCVWNLLSLTMMWVVALEVELLIGHHILEDMAVFTKDKKLFLFSPGSPQLLHSHDLEETVECAVFVPTVQGTGQDWYHKSAIYFINSAAELYCFSSEAEPKNEFSWDLSPQGFSKPALESVLPKNTSANSGKSAGQILQLSNIASYNKTFEQFLDNSIQTMLPLHLLCGTVLRSLELDNSAVVT